MMFYSTNLYYSYIALSSQTIAPINVNTTGSTFDFGIVPYDISDIIVSGTYTLTEDIVCNNLFISSGTLNLNGYELAVYGDVEQI